MMSINFPFCTNVLKFNTLTLLNWEVPIFSPDGVKVVYSHKSRHCPLIYHIDIHTHAGNTIEMKL